MLKFEQIQKTLPVAVKSGANIEVNSIMRWSEPMPDNLAPVAVITVRGELSERGHKWQNAWVFEWPAADIGPLVAAMHEFRTYVNERRNYRFLIRKEAFQDIFDWLRIGWVDQNKDFYGYVRFQKNGEYMESVFDNINDLGGFRSAVEQALQH